MSEDTREIILKYPLAMDNWNEQEISAIESVIQSNRYTMGEQVRLFESEVASKFGSRFAVMVNSGSSANMLMLTAAKIFIGDKFSQKVFQNSINSSYNPFPPFISRPI